MNRTTGKQVNLQLNVGKAELDKSVAERVFPALVHLIRNAVDHAIESPEERTRLGKPPEGTIVVACLEHSDTQLEIRVSDDGRGIDVAALSRRLGRGTPSDNRGILELITQPGVSTLVAATSSSGRGMGMDIVRRIAVDMLGGDLTLQTQAGRGTTFTMRLPLSISILDSFSFVCGAQAFAVPVSIVDEIVDLSTERIVQPPAPRETGRKRNGGTKSGRARESMVQLIERRGEAIPLFRLARLLKLAATPGGHGKAFIVRPQGQPFAFAIDRVLGQQEIVVRPLEDRLVKVPGVAGTTDLGDGKPTLVLDLAGLSNMATARSGSAA
jgi:two-component system chemotaxis sensor kinase CheA